MQTVLRTAATTISTAYRAADRTVTRILEPVFEIYVPVRHSPGPCTLYAAAAKLLNFIAIPLGTGIATVTPLSPSLPLWAAFIIMNAAATCARKLVWIGFRWDAGPGTPDGGCQNGTCRRETCRHCNPF